MARKWIEAQSSMIKGYWYEPDKEELYLRFHSGARPQWKYYPVSNTDFFNFKSAPSLGRFFIDNIKSNPGITAEPLNEE